MTLDELHTKWFKGPCEVNCEIANAIGRPIIKRPGKEHVAPLGDFLTDYIEHLNLPWWKRKWDWRIVKGTMRDSLNVLSIRFNTLL